MKIKAGMEKKLRIILLEDLPRDVEIIRELLIDADMIDDGLHGEGRDICLTSCVAVPTTSS